TFYSASYTPMTPGENSHISTNSFTRVGPRCQRLAWKRSPIRMPRGYEPEDFLTPRDASGEREPATEQSSRDPVARDKLQTTVPQWLHKTRIEPQLLPLSPGR